MKKISSIQFGISLKSDGNMRLFDKDGNLRSSKNKELFFSKIGLNFNNAIYAILIHSNCVKVVDSSDRGKNIENCDALITNEKDVILAITNADCLPIYFYDDIENVIAIAHAGWRGVSKSIVIDVINKFIDTYHSNPKNIKVFIGPHIQKCHFEVGDDVLEEFTSYSDFIIDNKFINLGAVVRYQLEGVGLESGNIEISDECTYCLSDKYFSRRRERENFEAMIAYIKQ